MLDSLTTPYLRRVWWKPSRASSTSLGVNTSGSTTKPSLSYKEEVVVLVRNRLPSKANGLIDSHALSYCSGRLTV